MKELSALDLHHLIQEFQLVADSKVENIYQKAGTVFFIFHKSGHGKIILKIMLPHFIYMTDYKEEMPQNPPQFCTNLRKHLKTARIRSIEQLDFERILKLKFTTKDKTYYLMIELFSKGNAILCNEQMKIIYPMTHQKWKDRLIKGGQMYKYPKKDINPLTLTEKKLSDLLNTTKKDSIVTLIASDLSFGGTHAEEVCKTLNISKTEKPKKNDPKLLYTTIKKFLNKVPKLNDQLDKALTEKTIKEQKETKEKSHKEKKTKVSKILDSQNKIILSLKKGLEENNQKGELIYQNYNIINSTINELNKIRKNHTWKEIKEKLKKHKLIKKVDEKNRKITLEL